VSEQGMLPKINNAKIFGVRPGSAFIFPICASGGKPIKYSASNLPKNLSVNPYNGVITGKIMQPGQYDILLKVENEYGKAEQNMKILVGEEIALTPPMGWNHWNCYGENIDENKVKQTAEFMISSGLKDHGWIYINIDDGWQGQRDPETLALQPNEKFRNIKALCDYVHSLGLKIGIYSTPWRRSYGGFPGDSADDPKGIVLGDDEGHTIGKYRFEEQDAKQFAEWGIDYLKYDWYPIDIESVKRMYEALHKSGREIVLSLSNSVPLDIVEKISKYAQCWRTTGDAVDLWDIEDKRWRIYTSIKEIILSQKNWIRYAKPGHWNDMDMLVVGNINIGGNIYIDEKHPNTINGYPRPTRLNQDEQYSHISLWCLLNSPLLLGCDLSSLDEFTFKLLTNDEVIGINQDSLGRQPKLIRESDEEMIWSKDLEDGSKVIGLLNLSKEKRTIEIEFQEINFPREVSIRDVWEHTELGVFKKNYKTEIPSHGIKLLKVIPVT
jgi:alpha-galactosidase